MPEPTESDFKTLADAAFRQAMTKVIARARRFGTPVIIWRDGQIERISPDEAQELLDESAKSVQGSASSPRAKPATPATIGIDEAEGKLRELIHELAPGGEVVITENQQPIAKLVTEPPKSRNGLRPAPGLGKGYITVVSDDEEHLRDFEEYLP